MRGSTDWKTLLLGSKTVVEEVSFPSYFRFFQQLKREQ
jgi:hypothetical protein